MIDWTTHFLDPIYCTLGVPATFTPNGTGDSVAMTVIDKTSGIEVGGALDVLTIVPAAALRMSELTSSGYSRSNLDGGTIEFNDSEWTIEAHRLNPSPGGSAAGEIYLLLTEA
jgi:hypothetical protein